jgi:Domain of unknown function (DUF4405)
MEFGHGLGIPALDRAFRAALGLRLLFLGLTKREWGDLHLWFSLIALGVTLLHLVIDWRGLYGCLHYLASVHRDDKPEELANIRGKNPLSI